MTVVEKLVTPALATKWLEGNVLNRSIRDSVVERYARDMRTGKWQLTHEAIAFAPDGTLIDGQHRLWAVIKAECGIRMMVAFDVNPTSRAVINSGLVRTDTDHLKLGYGMDLSTMHTAIAKRLLKPHLTTQRPTTDELKATIDKHLVAMNFAIKSFPRIVRGITTVPVLTVFVRAYYHTAGEKLAHAGEVLCTGRIENMHDEPLHMLRSFLLERAPRSTTTRIADMVYAKTERALTAYLLGEKIGMLYPAAHELFPLPEEKTVNKQVGTNKRSTVVADGIRLPGKAGKAPRRPASPRGQNLR